MNIVHLIGNLGDDPEARETNSGTAVCNFSIATNRQWTDNDGNQQQDTEWHNIVVFGKQAESCAEYLSKGRQVAVMGRISTNEWEDDNGNTRRDKEVIAQRVKFLSGEGDSSSSSSDDFEEREFDDDDIPF